MQALFSPDSSFMQFMGRVADLIILNFLFLFTSIPLFTIGASLTALYTVCFRFDTEREEGIFKSYFQAFGQNFKQSTVLFLILALIAGISGFDILLFYVMAGPVRYLFILFSLLFVISLMIICYAFPLASQFNNKVTGVIKNAAVLSIAYLPRTILVVAMHVIPFVLLLTDYIFFLQIGILWVLIYFAGAAYFSTLLLRKVFKPYMQEADLYETTPEE